MVTTPYDQEAMRELHEWQYKMQRRPGILSGVSRNVQGRINNLIPEKVHQAITATFKHLTNGLLTGADFITADPVTDLSLQAREAIVHDKITVYKNTAMAEGAITGAGGILLGLADLPLWLSIKVKMLADIAALYGHDTGNFEERLYMLQILQLQFSSRKHRRIIYRQAAAWEQYLTTIPKDGKDFDWRTFQQEYRDYLDIAKLLQLVPGIGAVVGATVNHKLTQKLGDTAMNAYRLRWFEKQ